AYGASGYAPDGNLSAMNFLEPYLVSLMGFLGIKQTEVVRIEGTTGSPDALSLARQAAAAEISNVLTSEVTG
ncbi:MAG: NAD(P)H-dependent oxidoreductase, partial [Woeseiaceae bacterium]